MVEEEGFKSKFLKITFLHKRGEAWHRPMEALAPFNLDYRLRSHWVTHCANFWTKKCFCPENKVKGSHISLEKDGKKLKEVMNDVYPKTPGRCFGVNMVKAGARGQQWLESSHAMDASSLVQHSRGILGTSASIQPHQGATILHIVILLLSYVLSICVTDHLILYTLLWRKELITQTLRLNWT